MGDVTFMAATPDEPLYRVLCDDGQLLGESTDFDAARVTAAAHSLVCGIEVCRDDQAEIREVHLDGLVPLTMADRNALDLLALLGLMGDLDNPEYVGEISPADLIVRIDTAMSVGFVDEELPTIEHGNEIDYGRSKGYLSARLTQLRELASSAQNNGITTIVWA